MRGIATKTKSNCKPHHRIRQDDRASRGTTSRRADVVASSRSRQTALPTYRACRPGWAVELQRRASVPPHAALPKGDAGDRSQGLAVGRSVHGPRSERYSDDTKPRGRKAVASRQRLVGSAGGACLPACLHGRSSLAAGGEALTKRTQEGTPHLPTGQQPWVHVRYGVYRAPRSSGGLLTMLSSPDGHVKVSITRSLAVKSSQ
ncbi:hypothetical protein GGR56DRAFT_151731 [Xylariaceae sp. FL0804]|nr:hypothetical protein GGR56DRAFT_151731 [Xylariaceae sp. FL0804]